MWGFPICLLVHRLSNNICRRSRKSNTSFILIRSSGQGLDYLAVFRQVNNSQNIHYSILCIVDFSPNHLSRLSLCTRVSQALTLCLCLCFGIIILVDAPQCSSYLIPTFWVRRSKYTLRTPEQIRSLTSRRLSFLVLVEVPNHWVAHLSTGNSVRWSLNSMNSENACE
ncbi:hypothetical protein EV361DRAFT_423476 [Lentinula raphanica]|nr:hypothetical protein F5880DRAFT_875191 [Lentinula raphanica]KAJ3968346.1 hypothetical protein EV361DRAFT_423476 [Lentinula raphanica]